MLTGYPWWVIVIVISVLALMMGGFFIFFPDLASSEPSFFTFLAIWAATMMFLPMILLFAREDWKANRDRKRRAKELGLE